MDFFNVKPQSAGKHLDDMGDIYDHQEIFNAEATDKVEIGERRFRDTIDEFEEPKYSSKKVSRAELE